MFQSRFAAFYSGCTPSETYKEDAVSIMLDLKSLQRIEVVKLLIELKLLQRTNQIGIQVHLFFMKIQVHL